VARADGTIRLATPNARRWMTRVRRAIAGVLVALALLGAPWVSATQAHAAPRVIDPEPIDDIDPPFEAPPGGFDWTVPNRLNVWRWNDLRDAAPSHSGPAETYDPAYVHPTQFPMDFNGCPDESELNLSLSRQPTRFTYTWNIAGSITSARSCLHRHVFAAQGSYAARLTIDGGAQPASYEQTVRVRDLLIVSLGDSYGSGEGNPDIPQVPGLIFPFIDQQVDWLDDRCHRSVWAGPTQAALAIERADPKTSVTYLSFACSGATIDTETFRNGDVLDPYEPGGVSAGKGILGDYAGVAPPGSPPDFSNRVPSQSRHDARSTANGRRRGSPPAIPRQSLEEHVRDGRALRERSRQGGTSACTPVVAARGRRGSHRRGRGKQRAFGKKQTRRAFP
jgi:hypothetical protein